MSIAISTLYGGAHLSAWNAHFPTEIEKWMWRSSGIILASLPLAMEVAFQFLFPDIGLTGMFHRRLKSSKRTETIWENVFCCIGCVPLTVTFVILAIYPVARVYFLAESFASLRSPPLGAYRTVEWTAFIPHAS